MEKKEEQKVEEVKIENNDTHSKSEPQKNPGLYTAGLVCSIVGLCLFWSVWVGLICGILGIVFAAVTYKKTNSNAPIILGSFATGLAIIMIIIYPILVKNIFDYIYQSMKTTIRMFIVYRPFRFFITLSGLVGLLGFTLVCRFLYFYLQGDGNGHIQSLIFAAVFLISAVILVIVAIIGDLLSINRKLLEDIQTRVKNIEFERK